MRDHRRYRDKSDGTVYVIVNQVRSPTGPVTLRPLKTRSSSECITLETTNDRLAIDFDFFEDHSAPPDDFAAINPPSAPKFPTPDEIRKRHAALVAPRVNAVVAAIREAVEKNGARQCSVLASWSSGEEDLIRAAIEPSGWMLEFGSDQRDGSWIKVSPR